MSIIMKMLCLAIFEMFSIGDCWDALLKMIMMVVIRIIIIKIVIVGIVRFMIYAIENYHDNQNREYECATS